MKKNKWLIIPIILNLLLFFIIPASAAEEFVSFDFYYKGSGLEGPGTFATILSDSGYNSPDNPLVGTFEIGPIWYVELYAVGSSLYGRNANDSYFRSISWNHQVLSKTVSFSSHDENLYEKLTVRYPSLVEVHTRFVLDYFPTDVLSYFFYRFFENNYILWSIGIWILAIAFKMIFSTSGVLRCTRGF